MNIGKPFKDFKNLLYPKGSITQYFGVNSEYYNKICIDNVCLAGHNGIDFVAPWGTPILAVEDGVVIETEVKDGYGKHVRILSGDTEWTYGHLSKVSVFNRQVVKQGDVIGNMGNTGMVFPKPSLMSPLAGTHLHLGCRVAKNGVIQNYNNGYFGSIDFMSRLPQIDPINDDIEGFVELLKSLLLKLQKANIQLQRPPLK